MFPELVICKILPTLEFRDKIEKRVELIERRTDETGSQSFQRLPPALCKPEPLGQMSLPFDLCCSPSSRLPFSLLQYNKPSETVLPESVDGLQENLDVVVSLAERHYYNCDFKMCYKLTSV